MNSLSNLELEQFYAAILSLFERVRAQLAGTQQWALLHRVQEMAQYCQGKVFTQGKLTAWVASAQQMMMLKSLLTDLMPFDEAAEKLAAQTDNLIHLISPASTFDESHAALARKLFTMHNFLNGVAGTEDFGSVSAERHADFRYGLGLELKNGSLLKFFSRLNTTEQSPQDNLITRHFEDDSEGLIEAIEGGQTSLEQYMQSQLILRFDPVLSRKVYSMSDTWLSRFNRLGKEPAARAAQIDLVAGDRFQTARVHAQQTGIRSLRGFAMLFDLHTLAPDDVSDRIEAQPSESQKWHSLADEVIGRMHGHIAAHWQNRLSTVMQGRGFVEHRFYDENQFLGEDAAKKDWESVDFSAQDERDTPEPCSGHTYVICPGDRLSQLVQKAYGSEGDYRLILRQNPQILQPENLQPGMRIYFPELRHIRSAMASIQKNGHRGLSDLGEFIQLNDKRIGPLGILSPEQLEAFKKALLDIPANRMAQTIAIEMISAVMISCNRTGLFVSSDDNVSKAATLWPDKKNPLLHWAMRIAAQIRGDIEVNDHIYMPLASIPSQPHRREWMTQTLRNLLANTDISSLKLILHAKSRCVDIVDGHNETILRLEKEDFDAIREQPWRRLSDFVAPPIAQLEALSQIWIGDLFQTGAEIAVPPVVFANQYAIQQFAEEIHFIVPIGTPVYPMMRGNIVYCARSADNDHSGYVIIIQHDTNLFCKYTCLATVNVTVGQSVMADTMIARSGMYNTSLDSEPGLIVQIFKNELSPLPDQNMRGDFIDYFDFVYNIWPSAKTVECVVGS